MVMAFKSYDTSTVISTLELTETVVLELTTTVILRPTLTLDFTFMTRSPYLVIVCITVRP
jgi:hypothetical protein